MENSIIPLMFTLVITHDKYRFAFSSSNHHVMLTQKHSNHNDNRFSVAIVTQSEYTMYLFQPLTTQSKTLASAEAIKWIQCASLSAVEKLHLF